jgi:hypothetical protein
VIVPERIAPARLAVQESGRLGEQRASEEPLYCRDVPLVIMITINDADH